MPLESQRKLYDAVSGRYDIGDFNAFSNKMQSPESRRKFYDQVSQAFDLGDYETFETKISSKAPAVNPQDVFIGPEEPPGLKEPPTSEERPESQGGSFKKVIYDSVRQQENSIAKNNPYGVNLPPVSYTHLTLPTILRV